MYKNAFSSILGESKTRNCPNANKQIRHTNQMYSHNRIPQGSENTHRYTDEAHNQTGAWVTWKLNRVKSVRQKTMYCTIIEFMQYEKPKKTTLCCLRPGEEMSLQACTW